MTSMVRWLSRLLVRNLGDRLPSPGGNSEKNRTGLSEAAIKQLGFDWPHNSLLAEHSHVEAGLIDLVGTLDNLRASRVFHQKQINAAYRFKQQTGADYADFTDRFDDHVRQVRELGAAIAYVEGILTAVTQTSGDTKI